jgi:serine protease
LKTAKAVLRAVACLGALFSLSVGTAWAESNSSVIIKWQLTPQPSVVSASAAKFGVTLTLERTLATGGVVYRANRVMTATELKNLIADLDASTSIIYVHDNVKLRSQFTPNDALFSQQWNLLNTVAGIDVQRAWDVATGAGVRVAVLDSGYRPSPDLTPNIIGGYDFITDPADANDGNGRDSDPTDPGDASAAGECYPGSPATNSSWHGTHVMGTIAAAGNNGQGVTGVAFGAKLVPIRVTGKCIAELADVAEAVLWAVGRPINGVPVNPYPARLINMSLAAPVPCNETSQYVIDTARSFGAILVVAAGNGGVDVSGFVPGGCNGVITVAATTKTGGKAYYTNFGQNVDVAAPGGDIRTSLADGVLSTINTGTGAPGTETYGFEDGTSMATAQVSGVVALMLQRAPNLPADVVESLLRKLARPFPQPCDQCGEGIVDAFAAVDAAADLPRGYAFILGGMYEPKWAGESPLFVADQLGFIAQYKLTRRNGNVTQVFTQSSPVFNNLPAMGCAGEDMYWTLETTDAAGRVDSWTQRTVFFFRPGNPTLPCGR